MRSPLLTMTKSTLSDRSWETLTRLKDLETTFDAYLHQACRKELELMDNMDEVDYAFYLAHGFTYEEEQLAYGNS